VSIKNKLVTAVTTAGLLAGLFGSAFVPVAWAADADDLADGEGLAEYSVECTGEDPGSEDDLPALEDLGDADVMEDGVCSFVSSVAPVLVISATAIHNDDDGDWTITVSGSTIKSMVVVANPTDGGTINSTTVNPSDYLSGTINMTVDNGNDQGFAATLTLNKLAAGDDATVTVTNSDDVDVIVVTVDAMSASLKNTVSADYSTIDTDQQRIDDNDYATDGLLYVYNLDNDLDNDDNDMAEIAVEVDNVYNADPAVFPVITSTVTGDLLVASTTAADCNSVTAGEYDKTSTVLSDTNGNTICLIAENADATDAGAATLTVVAGGVTLVDADIKIIGQVTSITATRGAAYFAVGGTRDGSATLNLAKMTYKDAAGQDIKTLCAAATEVCLNGGGDVGQIDILDDALTFKRNGVTTATIDAGDGPNFGAGTSADSYISYNNPCTGKSSGDVITLSASYENADEDTYTASWTVTCTDADGIITKVAAEKLSGAPGSDVTIVFTVTDSEGLPLGYGGSLPEDSDMELSLSPDGSDATNEIRDSAGNALTVADFDGGDVTELVIVDGVVEVDVQLPTTAGNYAFLLDLSDIGDGVNEASYTIRLTSTNVAAAPTSQTLTAGPKKLVATANFGISAAGSKIAFTLERSNGTVKTYYRKANADGVAKFTLRFRGTFEVTASFGDYITDTVILKK
jgi:hypothetical protein